MLDHLAAIKERLANFERHRGNGWNEWAYETFLDHAPEDIAALVAEVERLQAKVEELEEAPYHHDILGDDN